jgi:hypothetical protein
MSFAATSPNVRSVSQYRALFDNIPPWQAAEWVLRDLNGYRLMGRNNYLPADRERLANALLAFVLAASGEHEAEDWS